MGGAVKFVKQVGKEITGDAERERKRAADRAAAETAALQEAQLAEVEAEKARVAEEEERTAKLAAAKKERGKGKSTGRRGTILTDQDQFAAAQMQDQQRTLLGR